MAGRSKRLKSLNEFTPPYWLGLFKLRTATRPRLFVPIVIGLVGGIALGLAIVT